VSRGAAPGERMLTFNLSPVIKVRLGILSNRRRFSVEYSLQGISLNSMLRKQNNSSVVM